MHIDNYNYWGLGGELEALLVPFFPSNGHIQDRSMLFLLSPIYFLKGSHCEERGERERESAHICTRLTHLCLLASPNKTNHIITYRN